METPPSQLDPFKYSINMLLNINRSFQKNEETVNFTKKNLQFWLNKDMDRSLLGNDEDVQHFYASIYGLLSDFESEHANCENIIIITNSKIHLLLQVIYPKYIEVIFKYFETLPKMTQNAIFINSFPSFQVPPHESLLYFSDRFNVIIDNFFHETKNYNKKIVEIDQMHTLNHKKILNNNLIQRLLKDDKSYLRKIFNSIEVTPLSLLPKEYYYGE